MWTKRDEAKVLPNFEQATNHPTKPFPMAFHAFAQHYLYPHSDTDSDNEEGEKREREIVKE
jgi:hypothetical protein